MFIYLWRTLHSKISFGVVVGFC